MNIKIFKLIISIGLPLIIGFVGSFFTAPAISTWYVNLQKPFFNPPSWIFGPVWTIFYVMMGISLYLFWQTKVKKELKKAYIELFLFNLFLNGIWSILFFGLKSPGIAFLEIIVLWFSIISVIILFWRFNKVSGILLIPYLLWVSFAAILNYAIFVLN